MHRFHVSVALSLAFRPSLAAAHFESDPIVASTIVVNGSLARGRWEGWGTSLAWWAKAFGDRDDLADILFTLDQIDAPTIAGSNPVCGLGLNIVRYNAGACSWNKVGNVSMVTLGNRKASREMEGFWVDNASDDPASPSWNWTVDASQRNMMFKARDRGAGVFELFSNSPMWWMLRNRNPSGGAEFGEANLVPGQEPLHAKYLATVVDYAKENWNITFRSVSPFNEPALPAWREDSDTNTQEGCSFGTSSQIAVIKALRKELQERLLETDVHVLDENTIDQG